MAPQPVANKKSLPSLSIASVLNRSLFVCFSLWLTHTAGMADQSFNDDSSEAKPDAFEQLLQQHQQESQRLRAAMQPAPEPEAIKVQATAQPRPNDLLEAKPEVEAEAEAQAEAELGPEIKADETEQVRPAVSQASGQDSIQLKMAAPKRSNSNTLESSGIANPPSSGRFYRRVRSR